MTSDSRPSNVDDERSSSLCTQCGLCCAGMFDFVGLQKNEVAQLSELGFDIVRNEDGRDCFKFPCPAFSAPVCTIYEQRPTACQSFRCKILKAFDAGEMDRDQAMALITEGRSMLDLARRSLPETPESIQPRRLVELTGKHGRAKDAPIDPARAEASLRLLVVNRFFDKHFRSSSERVMKVLPIDGD